MSWQRMGSYCHSGGLASLVAPRWTSLRIFSFLRLTRGALLVNGATVRVLLTPAPSVIACTSVQAGLRTFPLSLWTAVPADDEHSLGSCCPEESIVRSHLLRESDRAPADPRALCEAIRRSLLHHSRACLCVAWCPGGVCVVRGVWPYRRYCDEPFSSLPGGAREPQSGFPDGAGRGAGRGGRRSGAAHRIVRPCDHAATSSSSSSSWTCPWSVHRQSGGLSCCAPATCTHSANCAADR